MKTAYLLAPDSSRAARAIRMALAAACAAAAANLLVSLPSFSLFLAIALSGYVIALWRNPFCWLLVIPIAIPLLDLTAWTGRVILNEWDLLLWITFAVGLLRWQPLTVIDIGSKPRIFLVLLWLLSSVGGLVWMLPALFDAAPLLSLAEHSPGYRFSQVKGALYGTMLFLLWTQLRRLDYARAVRYLCVGMMLSSLALFIVILWERGVFIDLLSSGGYYHRLRTLLDFTSNYRVTGLFSAMRNGGEAIDGFILLTMPFALIGTLRFSGWLRWLALLAMLCATYSVITTFTRTTYAAFIVTIAIYALIELVNGERSVSRGQLGFWSGALILFVVAAVLVFKLSGNLGVLAIFAVLGFGFLRCAFGFLRHLSPWLSAAVYVLLVCLGLYAQLTSKWLEPDIYDVILQALLLITIAAASHSLGRRLTLTFEQAGMGLMLVLGVSFMFVATSNYRMMDRLSSAGRDLSTRVEHWSSVLTAMDPDLSTLLWGMGVGAFPVAYALNHPERVNDAGSLAVLEEQGQRALELGLGGDLLLSQRLEVIPDSDYSLSFRARAAADMGVRVGFCQRNVLFAADYGLTCSSQYLVVTGTDDWQTYNLTLNSKNVGKQSILKRWPTSFYLAGGGGTVRIDDVLISLNTEVINQNGGFEQGLDHWLPYYDYKHLPWHIKNSLLAVYFERGVGGLIIFIMLCFFAVLGGLRKDQPLSRITAISIIGLTVVGVMENPLDSPKIAMLFTFILLLGLFDIEKKAVKIPA